MRLQDLKEGMIVQTTHNRFGVVERDCINIIYDPDYIDDGQVLEKIPLSELVEVNSKIGVGLTVTKEDIEKFNGLFSIDDIGKTYLWYEFVAVYTLTKIYDNGEGIYPNIIVE